MNYSLNHKIDEANLMYRVCEGIRKRLLALVEAGGDKLECAGKLLDFYEVASPRQAKILERYPDEGIVAHLLASVGTHIYVHLGPDEHIDFFKLRDFLKAEWSEVDHEVFVEKKSSYFTVSGKELVIDPSSGLLLEKAGLGRAHPDQPIFIDMSKPIEATYGQEPDVLLKTEHGAPISFATIQEVDAEMAKMHEDIKYALYRYWSALTVRDIPMQLEWTHFGTFACWAVKNGYQLGYRLERTTLEEGYVIGNVKWAEVVPRPPLTDLAGNRVFTNKKDGEE